MAGATRTWSALNGEWTTSENWSGGLPGSGDTAAFANPSGAGPLTITLGSNQSILGIRFTAPSGNSDSFIFNGAGNLTILGGGIANSDLHLNTFNFGITLGSDQVWEVQNSGDLMFNGAITGGGRTLTLQGSSTSVGSIRGGISGLGGLIKSGTGSWTITTGTITLGGSQTWNMTDGSLTISSNVSTASGDVLTLQAASTKIATILGAISGAGSLLKTDAGLWNLSAANSFSGGATVSGGALRLSGANSNVGNVSVASGAVLEIGLSNTLPAATGLTLSGGTLALTGNFNQTFTSGLNLTAGTSSTLDFGAPGAGNTISFGSSSGNWTTGTSLTIANYTFGSDQLRFGTSAAGLSSLQLTGISFIGFAPGAEISAAGFVTPVPEPSTYAAVAGVLALAVAGYRRRRSAQARPAVESSA